VPAHDPVHKVSIIPRGRALGVTLFLPEGARFSYSKQRLESSISGLFGGRLLKLGVAVVVCAGVLQAISDGQS
jgi:ATP-dependent Zn protease